MKTITYFLFWLFVCTVASSCRPGRISRDGFSSEAFCYSTRNLKSENMIRTDGYYLIIFGRRDTDPKYLEHFCLFYKDGTAIFYYDHEYFLDAKDRYFGFYNRGTQWGSYEIKEDTVRMLVIESPGSTSWLPTEYILKIEDQNSIRLLYTKNPYTPEKGVIANYLTDEVYGSMPGRFIPESNLPDPDMSWLKRRKWYWCNEEEYKTWKKSLKSK